MTIKMVTRIHAGATEKEWEFDNATAAYWWLCNLEWVQIFHIHPTDGRREIFVKQAKIWLVENMEADADLRGVDLDRADLRGLDLRGVTVGMKYVNYYTKRGNSGTTEAWTSLRHADLRGANLSGLDLRDVDMYGSNTEGANIEGAQLPEIGQPVPTKPQAPEVSPWDAIAAALEKLDGGD